MTRDALRAAGRGYHSADVSRQQAANEAFRATSLYSRRYQISISAPPEIVRSATATFLSLRELRTVGAADNNNDSEEYVRERERYESLLVALMEAMREDLAPVTGQD
jgi:hypothetical protein